MNVTNCFDLPLPPSPPPRSMEVRYVNMVACAWHVLMWISEEDGCKLASMDLNKVQFKVFGNDVMRTKKNLFKVFVKCRGYRQCVKARVASYSGSIYWYICRKALESSTSLTRKRQKSSYCGCTLISWSKFFILSIQNRLPVCLVTY